MHIPTSPEYPFIHHLRISVLFSTLLYALLQSLSGPTFLFSEIFVTSPAHSMVLDLLSSPLSLLTLNCSSLTLQLLFDFLILNLFLTPLASFVFSFLGKVRFIAFILISAASSSLFLHSVSYCINQSFVPTTLFAHVSLSLLSFWACLNVKYTTTRFLFLPLKPMTILIISFLIPAFPAFLYSDWMKIGSLLYALSFGATLAFFYLCSFYKR